MINNEYVIKDKNGKEIKEKALFKFDFKCPVTGNNIPLVGSFNWDNEDLRYEIDIHYSDEYTCLWYVSERMSNFELVKPKTIRQ